MNVPRYRVHIGEIVGEIVAGDSQMTSEQEVLTLRVDALHEIAPKLAALYPAPVVKRMHRRKKEATA